MDLTEDSSTSAASHGSPNISCALRQTNFHTRCAASRTSARNGLPESSSISRSHQGRKVSEDAIKQICCAKECLQGSCVDYVLVKPGRLPRAYLPRQNCRPEAFIGGYTSHYYSENGIPTRNWRLFNHGFESALRPSIAKNSIICVTFTRSDEYHEKLLQAL
jgi:hypothetical protein